MASSLDIGRVASIAAAATTAGLLVSCGPQPVDQHNFDASVTSVGPVTNGERAVMVDYALRDHEGDDQTVDVDICESTDGEPEACGDAVQGIGGDGTETVPTVPRGDSVTHRFAWAAGCGRVVDGSCTETDVSTTYVARVSLEDVDDAATSAPFSLGEDLGFDDPPECRLDDDALPDTCRSSDEDESS